MSHYGIDFRLTADANGVPDADIYDALDGQPEAIHGSDVSNILANKGDYTWDPCTQDGSDVFKLKGKMVSRRDLDYVRANIDAGSMGDPQIIGSETSYNNPPVDSNGVLQISHQITLDSGSVLSSNISIGGQSATVFLGQ
jgi:hypothetical protein